MAIILQCFTPFTTTIFEVYLLFKNYCLMNKINK